jgi:uncharacterized protein
MARMELGGAGMIPTADVVANGQMFFELGMQYSTGRDCRLYLVEAHKWFTLAAMQGYSEAAEFRQEVARELSREAVAAAQRAARDFVATH